MVNRLSIPKSLIPADATVEIEAKKAAGYYVGVEDEVLNEEGLKHVQGRKIDE